MSEREMYDAEREARQEVAAHPQRADRTDSVLNRFLSIIGHRTRGPEEATKDATDSVAGRETDAAGE